MPDSPAPPVLEAQGLAKAYGAVRAIRDAAIRCDRGQVTALVGDNGAGKSTLIRCVTGVHPPDSGTIRCNGHVVHFASPMQARALGIETVYQDLALIEELSVWQNMYLNRELKWGIGPFRLLNRRAMIDGADRMLRRLLVNMPPVRAKVRRLSGGQRQSIAIGRAASWGSSLVIMDEPTAALGVQETRAVEELIARLRDSGVAQLVISHDMQQVLRISDSVWVMRQGRTVGHWRSSDIDTNRIVAAITGADGAPRGEAAASA